MSSYNYLDSRIRRNVDSKVLLYNQVSIGKRSPVIVIFTANQTWCCKMWENMFKRGAVQLIFSLEFDVIPLPDDYQPAEYDQYVNELNTYIELNLAREGVIWGLFNLGTIVTPELNLVLVDRKIRKTELAFRVRQNIPEAVARNAVAVGIENAGAKGSLDDSSSLGSTGSSERNPGVRSALDTSELASSLKENLTRLLEYVKLGSEDGMWTFDTMRICEALGTGKPVGSKKYVRSMDQLRREISSSIEEATAQDADE